MVNKMPHQLWRECCGDLSLVDWYLASYGLSEYEVDMRRAQQLLEDEENPAAAGVHLFELLDRINKDVTVEFRIRPCAARLGDRGALAYRISSLASRLIEYPVVDRPRAT